MNIKKIICILSLCVFVIIGSTFLLNEGEENSKPNDKVYTYENCTDLKSIDFIYPAEVYDITAQYDYDMNLEGRTLLMNSSEYKLFKKFYNSKHSIEIAVLCFYKDDTNNSYLHYFEENAEQVLSKLRTEGERYIAPLNGNSEVYSITAGEDFVAYTLYYEAYKEVTQEGYILSIPEYYHYNYISPGDPEIRIYIQYPEDFKEQLDLYISELEKTIKRK